jgi:predicted metal-dependent phosphoesterase TrpH
MMKMRLDLHVHTKYSADGRVEPKYYLKVAKAHQLHGFAVTDHNEIKGANETFQLAKSIKDLTIVRGVEVSSNSGHILAYGVNELIPRGLTVEETIEQIISQGGVAVAAHPYRLASGLGVSEVRSGNFEIIEVLNHRSPKHENKKAAFLAQELNTGITGGSDAHYHWELGSAATEFELSNGSEGDILQELAKKRTTTVGESSTYIQGLKMYGKLVIHWLKRGLRRV